MAYYSKDVNKKFLESEKVWKAQNSAAGWDRKAPIELALEVNMIGIIPYLLMKKADPYSLISIRFNYEDEENLDYMLDLGFNSPKKYVCVKSKKPFVCYEGEISRTIIGEAIAKNRLDVLKVLQKKQSGFK